MKIFGLIKKLFFTGLAILSNFSSINSLNAIPLSCISMSNQECRTRTQVAKVNEDENSNNPIFYPFSIKINKCSNINNPYAKICVLDVLKDSNVKVFNLMSRTNETRYGEWHEMRKYECKFVTNVCNNKQRWNKNKC